MPRPGYRPLVFDDFVRIRDSLSLKYAGSPPSNWCYSVTIEEGYDCELTMYNPDVYYIRINNYPNPSDVKCNLMELELELTSGRYYIYSYERDAIFSN